MEDVVMTGVRHGVVGVDSGAMAYLALNEEQEPYTGKEKPILIVKYPGSSFRSGFKEEWWSNGGVRPNAWIAYDESAARKLLEEVVDGAALIIVDAKRFRAL